MPAKVKSVTKNGVEIHEAYENFEQDAEDKFAPFVPGAWHDDAGEFRKSRHVGLVITSAGWEEGYVYDPAFLVQGPRFILTPGAWMWKPVEA